MPNPWDVGSAKLLATLGFEALATTSAGFAWSLGKLDTHVSRDELVAHVAQLAAATALPSTSIASAATRTIRAESPRDGRAPRERRRGRLLDRGLRPRRRQDRRSRGGGRTRCGRSRGRTRSARAARPDREGGEPPPRARRPRRHDRPPRRLPRGGRRRRLRTGPVRPRRDRERRRSSRRAGERPRAAERAERRRARSSRCPPRLDRRGAGRRCLRRSTHGRRGAATDGTSRYTAAGAPAKALKAAFDRG